MAWFGLQPSSPAEAPAPGSRRCPIIHLADAELKVVLIDSDRQNRFGVATRQRRQALRRGPRGCSFTSGHNGVYQPRQLLYRFPKDSWIYGIAIRGVDLYVSTHTAVYVLEGAVVKARGPQAEAAALGLPMLPYFEEHQGMHALAFGPEGDLYVSLGDNLVGYGDFKRADHWGH